MDKKCKKIHAGTIIHLQNENNGKTGAALWNLKIRPYFQKISLPLEAARCTVSLILPVISNVTIDIDIFVNCNWVYTQWQWYSTHNQYIGQHN
jgi:hypothetical protein